MKEKYYDSHLHLLGLGYIQSMIDLSQFKSIKQLVIRTTDKFVSRFQSSEYDIILGRGWHQADFEEKRYLQKSDLNQISTTHPIIFT